jgi:hypothetical protein
MQSYHTKSDKPLTKEELEEKLKEAKDEMNEVLEWKKRRRREIKRR